MTPIECAAAIREKKRQIEALEFEINNIAKDHIPDFHFMDYQVSTFWKCDKSPIGMCLFELGDYARPQNCRYCGDPVERK